MIRDPRRTFHPHNQSKALPDLIRRAAPSTIAVSSQHQLHHQLHLVQLRVLHSDLDTACGIASGAANKTVVQAADVAASNDLAQSAILGVADLDEVGVEEQDEAGDHGGRTRPPNELHDHAAADVAVLVDVHGALLVAQQELAVRQPEHAERLLAGKPLRDHLHVRGLEVGDRHRLLLVQRQDLEAALRRHRQARVEHVDPHALGRDVELVEVAEELGLTRAQRREARAPLARLLEHRLQHLSIVFVSAWRWGGVGLTVITLNVLEMPSRFL